MDMMLSYLSKKPLIRKPLDNFSKIYQVTGITVQCSSQQDVPVDKINTYIETSRAIAALGG